MTPAVFLDRDGTLIVDPGYLGNPAEVQLLPGVPAALKRLHAAGFKLIVISNQSGIGRGLLSGEQVISVNAEIATQLRRLGVRLSGWYWCPHLPTDGCDCRKPGTANHTRAATEHHLDLHNSWCVGDRLTDLLPARSLGAKAILVQTGDGSNHVDSAEDASFEVVADLGAAADLIVGNVK